MTGMGLGLGFGGGGGGGAWHAGVQWNQTTDAYARTGMLAGEALGVTPGNAKLPIHRWIKRVLVSDSGVENYYLSATDSGKKVDGSAADLTGADGQVMVRMGLLPTYYKYEWADPVHHWQIANYPKAGFAKHPSFFGTTQRVYMGAYYGQNVGGKLSSVSGQIPTASQTIATFRTQAAARGAGYHQEDIWTSHLMQLFHLIEYADFDWQTTIGRGIDQYSIWPGIYPTLTGNSNAIGNASGNNTAPAPVWAAATAKTSGQLVTPTVANNNTYQCTVAGTTGGSQPTWPTIVGNTVVDGGVTWTCVKIGQYACYRGIEYSGIWSFTDGFNVHTSVSDRSRAFVCDNPANYASDTETNYSLAGLLSEADGYGRQLMTGANGLFLPAGVSGGSSATGLADYYYTEFDTSPEGGWRVVLRGGAASAGLSAGAFFWYSNAASSTSGPNFAGRLCLKT